MEFTFFSEIILLVPDYSYRGTDGLAEYTHKMWEQRGSTSCTTKS